MPLSDSFKGSRPAAASLISADAVADVTQPVRGAAVHAPKADARTPTTARLARSMATRRAVRAPVENDIVSWRAKGGSSSNGSGHPGVYRAARAVVKRL